MFLQSLNFPLKKCKQANDFADGLQQNTLKLLVIAKFSFLRLKIKTVNRGSDFLAQIRHETAILLTLQSPKN